MQYVKIQKTSEQFKFTIFKIKPNIYEYQIFYSPIIKTLLLTACNELIISLYSILF